MTWGSCRYGFGDLSEAQPAIRFPERLGDGQVGFTGCPRRPGDGAGAMRPPLTAPGVVSGSRGSRDIPGRTVPTGARREHGGER